MNLDPFSKSSLDPFKSADRMNPSAPKDIFAKSRLGGGLGRVSRPVGAEEPMEAEPAAPEPQPEKKKKASVRLFNPKWEADKVGFNEETDISVELELPEEFAHKTKVAFELFAKTPKGPESISKADSTAKNGKAVGKIPVFIPNCRDEDGNRLQKVEYYFIAKHSEAEPLDGSKTPKIIDEMAERFIESHVLPDITFETGKSFLRPGQGPALADLCVKIKAWRARNPDGKLAVFGHADAVGQEEPNKPLSERRAQSVLAFLLKEPETWEELSGKEKWGLGAIQELLKHLGHDPGAPDGKDGPMTQAAVKSFQSEQGVPPSGSADASTRKALFKAFIDRHNGIDLKKKDFDDINGGPFMGCSEFNLLEETQGPFEKNRRVTVLHLKSNKNFPITYPCALGDVAKCRAQVKIKPGKRRRASFKCCFYDALVSEEGGGGGLRGDLELPDYDPGTITKPDPSGCACEDQPVPGEEDVGAITKVAWAVEKARCGGAVKVSAESTLADGTEVTLRFAVGDKACDEAKSAVKGGKIEFEWKVKGVGFAEDKDKNPLPEAEVRADLEAAGGKASTEKPLKVQTLVQAGPAAFDKRYTWGQYSVHAHFTQAVKGRRQNVLVGKKVIKAWGATYVRVSDAGIKGATPDFPWEGHRWAKSRTGHMVPDLYWDGKVWKDIPDGVTDDPTSFSTLPLIKTGDKFHHPSSAGFVWPDPLRDYEFDAPEFSQKRKVWKADSDKRWSNVWKLRRKECAADPKVGCCTYDVSVDFTMERTETYDDDTLCLAPGNLRSNAGLFFYGESRIPMAAHEVGHLVGLPDEYPGGAVDTAATGDGLAAGIDSTTLMGGDMMKEANIKIKKRHYANFLTMAKTLFKDAGGAEQEWVAAT